jgi:hypothetical protein
VEVYVNTTVGCPVGCPVAIHVPRSLRLLPYSVFGRSRFPFASISASFVVLLSPIPHLRHIPTLYRDILSLYGTGVHDASAWRFEIQPTYSLGTSSALGPTTVLSPISDLMLPSWHGPSSLSLTPTPPFPSFSRMLLCPGEQRSRQDSCNTLSVCAL